jgi:hypothetical protein
VTETTGQKLGVDWTDLLVGLIVLGLATGLLVLLPSQVGGETWRAIGNMRSPAFFAVLAGGFMGGLALLLILRGLLAGHAGGRGVTAPGDLRGLFMAAASLMLGVAATPIAGYSVAAALMMAGLSLAFGYRRLGIVLILALAVPLGIFVVFEGALRVLLPRGPF